MTTPMRSSSLFSTPTRSTPGLRLSSFVAAEHPARTAPVWPLHGTGLPVGGRSVVCSRSVSAAQVASGARVTDLLGLPPRGAPV